LIYFAIIAAVVFVGGVLTALFSDTYRGEGVLTALGAGLVAVITSIFAFTITVDAGEVVVPVLFGEVQAPLTSPGWQGIHPFASTVSMPTRTVQDTFEGNVTETNPLGAITALSGEGATITVDLTVLWHVNAIKAGDLYRTVGTSLRETLLFPYVRSATRNCMAQYEFEEARTSGRLGAAGCIKDSIASALDQRGIVVEEILLRGMTADAKLQAAIDQKLEAQNAVQEAEFLKQQAEVDALRAVVTAEGERQAAIIRAEGEAQANRLVAESLTADILQLRIFETLGDKAVVYMTGNEIDTVIPLPTP
jgi:regulator of protease activity HflC (stomatin/prohibitin superfamily)